MKYIIVDDNEIDMELASHFASLIPELQPLGKFTDPLKAFSVLNQANEIELILCDVDMPNLSGIELIKTLKNPPQVIFLTHHANRAVDGFDLEATDYLVKPYTFDRFLKAIRKAIEKANKAFSAANTSDDYFFIRSEQQFIRIAYNDVLYIEALKDYVKVVTPQHTYLSAVNLGAISEHLPENRFFRPSRSLIVNLDKVESMDNYELRIGGQSVLISEGAFKKMQERIINHKLVKR